MYLNSCEHEIALNWMRYHNGVLFAKSLNHYKTTELPVIVREHFSVDAYFICVKCCNKTQHGLKQISMNKLGGEMSKENVASISSLYIQLWQLCSLLLKHVIELDFP